MAKKNKDIEVKVESASSEGLEIDKSVSANFVDDLIQTFKDKGALLEAERLTKSEDKVSELDLILNDEEETNTIKMKKDLPFFK